MSTSQWSRLILIGLILPPLASPPSTTLAGLFGEKKAPIDGPITLQQAAVFVDLIDKRLFDAGTIGVKTPDIWGQNRMTAYRAEFENQMKTRLDNFQLNLQAAQNRTDISALTSATSLGATVAAAQSKKSGRFASVTPSSFMVNAGPTPTFSGVYPSGTLMVNAGASPFASLTPPTPASPTPASPTPADPGNPDFAGMASQLAAIAARIDTLKQGTLTLPSGINTFATKTGQTGVGIEPTIALDEEARYINHLHQLRRVNAGDDLTDMAGYGLYLLRMPVSLMPGPESRKGKGASVTVEARHDLRDDLLLNTFRDVAILDLTYALTQIVNEEIHQDIFEKCHTDDPAMQVAMTASKKKANEKKANNEKKAMMRSGIDGPKNVAGPNPFLIQDLRIILGPLDPPDSEDFKLEEILKDEPQADNGAEIPAAPGDRRPPFALIPGPTPLDDHLPPPAPTDPTPTTKPNDSRSDDQQDQAKDHNKQPDRDSKPSNVPRPLPLPLPNPGASRALPAGRDPIAKRDFVAKTQGPPVLDIRATRRYRTILSSRLDGLVDAMVETQKDPFRHDPSTLALFQESILDAYRFMRKNADRVDLFQVPRIEALGELLMRRDYAQLKEAREDFLWDLHWYRNHSKSVGPIPPPRPASPSLWENAVEPSDILAFALLLQFVNVDCQLKWDMKDVSRRRGCACAEVDGLCFYEFEPSPEARNVFKEYVACKWPLRIYSVDPVLDQQNVLDAYSRRTELQLALAVAVSTGQFNVKNATSFARQLDLDLQTVGLNRTSVGFGAGDTTFGWKFYPRVQPPQTYSNFRTFTNTLTGTGQGINSDLRGRRIEPGQRECIAMMVTPNFIPSIKVSTVTNWFDVTGMHAKQQLSNGEMLELSRKLQQAKAAVARACDSHEYRATDFTVLNQRIKQLEALLPTQDTRVDLPDEGDLLGSEVFSSNAAGLSPSLLAWYGEPVQDGTAGSIFLQGRGFSVSETQVVVGGIPLHEGTEFRLISRNVMQIIVPATARSVKIQLEPDPAAMPATAPGALATWNGPPAVQAIGSVADVQVGPAVRARAQLDPTLNDVHVTIGNANVRGGKVDLQVGDFHARAEGTPKEEKKMLPCDRAVIDVHIATPNGISNHLYVEVVPKPKPPMPKNAVTTATTTTTVDGNTTTTSTRFETTPPGTVLPPLTVLPMGTSLPQTTVLAPGPVTGAPTGSIMPGLVPTPAAPPVTPSSLTPPATPTPTPLPLPTTTPPAAPPSNIMLPPPPATSSVVPSPPAASVDGQIGVAGLDSSAIFRLPPLPPEAPKAVAGSAKSPATKRARPPILRRIGLPDR